MHKSEHDIIQVIKKQNGENFAHYLRDKNVLEIPNIIEIVKYAGHTKSDAIKIFCYLNSLKSFEKNNHNEPADNPFDLLHQAGYKYVEYADTLTKQNIIKKYFRIGEELCTFSDPLRYKNYYIINAVKDGIENIKPALFPDRQDEYGTSVISIQIKKGGGEISIKNRYNHSVDYPDNTFNSNPDNIIKGLAMALKSYFNIEWESFNAKVPDGYTIANHRIIKYNYEVCGYYFGPDFYETCGVITDINKDYQVVLDYFIWDNKQKKLLNPANIQDGFIDAFNTEIQNKKIITTCNKKRHTIFANGVPIVQSENGQIIAINFPTSTEISNKFLWYDTCLKELNLINAKKIGYDFLYNNNGLAELNLPSTEQIDKNCLRRNTVITKITAPKLTYLMNNCFYNAQITELNFPNLIYMENDCFTNNTIISKVNLPKLSEIPSNFLSRNNTLTDLSLPGANIIHDNFLVFNNSLKTLKIPQVKEIGMFFLCDNTTLQTLYAFQLEKIDDNALNQHPVFKKHNLIKLLKDQTKEPCTR